METRFITPTIPASIRDLRCRGYKNIYEWSLDNKNLFGTETLLGDWNGRILLVAEDFGSSSKIDDRLYLGEKHPYRHNWESPTNKNIIRMLRGAGARVTIDGSTNLKCSFLYISACFFLEDDQLSTREDWRPGSYHVLKFVLTNTKKIEKIVCLGNVSFKFVTRFFKLRSDWRSQLDSRRHISAEGYKIFALSHPSQRGLNMRSLTEMREAKMQLMQDDWKAVLAD